MSYVRQRPVEEGLFTWPGDAPRLIGSRCGNCGTVAFPKQPTCPKCCDDNMAEHLLSSHGSLWSWTVQGFPPKSPPYDGPLDSFKPYGVGYIELPGEIRVESRLTEHDPAKLKIGMAMEMILIPYRTDPDGTEVLTFAFRPRP